jgi:sigma-E factor negative regulatory protein RseC
MIEEEAVVTQLEAGQVWVEKTSGPSCGSSCAQPCATAAVADYLGKSRARIAVLSPIEVRPGDRVVIGIEEDALIKGSLSVYLVPLIGLLVGAILGKAIGGSLFSIATDAAALIGGLLGLIGTLIFLRFALVLPRNKLQPVVLRKLS